MIHNGSIVDPHDIDIIETSYTDSYWNLYFEFYWPPPGVEIIGVKNVGDIGKYTEISITFNKCVFSIEIIKIHVLYF